VDWNEVAAIATVVLAVFAAIAALYARLAYRTAKEDLEATNEIAREQIEAEHRPLLIDITPTAPAATDLDGGVNAYVDFPGGEEKVNIDGRTVYVDFAKGRVFFAVPLRNVGRGLAIIDPSTIRVKGAGVSARSLGNAAVQRERVPPGEMTRIVCTYESAPDDGGPPTDYEVWVPYTDLDESQSFQALVHIERIVEGEWRVREVEQIPA
jgi:hypothetical protein